MNKIENPKLKEWLYLELLNHIHFDVMLETTKEGRLKVKCEACNL